MKRTLLISRKKLVALALGLCVVTSFGFVDRYFEIARSLEIFAGVFREVNENYVDEVSPGELMSVGLEAMLASLDPYTAYVDQSGIEEYRRHYVSTQYAGIGVSVFTRNGKVTIAEPLEGFAAHKVGLRAGDVIVEVNGTPLNAQNASQVNDLLSGPTSSSVRLVVERPGLPQPLAKVLVRENITLRNVPYAGMLTDSIGYIKLDKFLLNATEEVIDALFTLRQHRGMQSLVLDLRGNGGGLVQESVKIVNLFVDRGQPIVTHKGRSRKHDLAYKARQQPIDPRIPLVVLVDANSASAAEIVAGAIQDLDRGTIIGQRTFGKGLVQQTVPLPYKSLLKITVGRYFTPSGRCLQALDYTHRLPDGSVSRLSDSLLTEYKTKHGRLVYNGSGIFPDVVTRERRYPDVVYSLMARSLPFDYATAYRNRLPAIAPAREFRLSDSVYADFMTFASARPLGYTSDTEEAWAQLKKAAEEDQHYEAIKDQHEAIGRKIQEARDQDLFTFREDVRQLLEEEIVSRYYLQRGRTEASFARDPEVSAAIRLLRDPKRHLAILRGDGPYKVIGRPGTEAYVKALSTQP